MSVYDDDRPREYYSLSESSRLANVIVRLEVGKGTDLAALSHAIKLLKRQMDRSGTHAAMKARAYGYVKPGQRARMKSLKARRLRWKAQRKRDLHVLRSDPEGKHQRVQAPPREVIA